MNLEDVILRSTRALQPAASAVAEGTLYFVTDESVIERSNGSAWQSYSGAASSGITQLTGNVTAGPGSGSQVATIANDAVTYAKMQNVSAASRLLGRGSAGGSGDPEEITLGAGLALTGTSLAATGAGALVLLSTQTASASAALNYTSLITSTYDEYLIELINVLPATTNVELNFQVSTDNGGTYDTGANYAFAGAIMRASVNSGVGGTAQTRIPVAGGGTILNTAARGGVSGFMRLFNPLSAVIDKHVVGQVWLNGNDGNFYNIAIAGAYQIATAVDAFRFIMSSGNIASGIIRLYGIAKT